MKQYRLMWMLVLGLGLITVGGAYAGGTTTEDCEDALKNIPFLKRYGKDLTAKMALPDADALIGRDTETQQMVEVLLASRQNNPVVVGDAGVGKTAVVEGLARLIARDQVVGSLRGAKIYELDIGKMMAGSKMRGEFEERLKGVIDEARNSKGQIILFIDELHTIIGAGSSDGNSLDAANLLKPPLARGELRVIGATTLDEYRKHIEKDPALARRFSPVLVDEPKTEQAVNILRSVRERLQMHHGVLISDAALTAAVKLSERYIGDARLPDKAIKLLDQAASSVQVALSSAPEALTQMESKMRELEMERSALVVDGGFWDLEEAVVYSVTPTPAQKRIQEIGVQLKALKSDYDSQKTDWEKRKNASTDYARLVADYDRLKLLLVDAVQRGDYNMAGKLQNDQLPRAKKAILEQRKSLSRDLKVTEQDIAQAISKQTKIPVGQMLANEKERLLQMDLWLSQRVIGQDAPVKAIANAVRRMRSGLGDPSRPVGSFLFLGPTGVGKTETAKALADFLFHDPNAMVRLDMGEFMEKHSIARLIGAPPGYVGYGEGGQLTEAVRRRPYSVVLFDEIEKAHPDVLNILLSMLDEGKIKDGQGRETSFKNTVILFSSNIGAQSILAKGDLAHGELMAELDKELRLFFKPEFLNRLDEVSVFSPLTEVHVGQIADLQLASFKKRLHAEKGVTLEFTAEGKKQLVTLGYDRENGARPLKRAIQRLLIDPIALLALQDRLPAGARIVVDAGTGDQLALTVQAP